MGAFWVGFEKQAEEKSKARKALPYVLGGAAALGLGALGARKFLKSDFHYRGAPATEGLLNKVRGAVSGFETARPHAMRSSLQTAHSPIKGTPELSTFDHIKKTWSEGSIKDRFTESGQFIYDSAPPILVRLPKGGGWEHFRKFHPDFYRDIHGRRATVTTKSFFKDKPSRKAVDLSNDDAGLAAALDKLKETGWQP